MRDVDLTIATKKMIDDLKTVCANYGLGNASSEYKIITEVFLYKFLNDKFFYEVKRVDPSLKNGAKVEEALNLMPDDEYNLLLMKLNPNTAKLKKEHYLSYLFNRMNTPDFHILFDNTLTDIANFNIDVFSVETASGEKIRLFDELSQHVIERANKDNFCKAIINKLIDFSFEPVFEAKYDFFATIFEYLIKDYNKDFGKYGEYFTPNAIARIMAKIMVQEAVKDVKIYDPAAGSGTLVLALAHQIGEDKCSIYTQDISQKSNEFLRLNLILNNLVHSLNYVIQGNTLTKPYHLNEKKNRLAQFDYVVCNPPFKMDFSDDREELAGRVHQQRFFAGIPKVPPKEKDSMAVYLVFIQHIIYSLNEKGKAAIVVPTGFLTASSSIEKKIRKYIVDNKMLKGVISMPSNIFANTGTNVSVLFIDKAITNGHALLVDASRLGTKIKDGKNQRTVLNDEEIKKIIDTFNNKEELEDFSVLVPNENITEKNYSFSAGQYFEIKIDYVDISEDKLNEIIKHKIIDLEKIFEKGSDLEKKLLQSLKEVHYVDKL
ncbi:class I SAM-dependent DNA methyltransferase [Chloroflexota bacterium]